MKYLKYFETDDNEHKYKIGDYVLLDLEEIDRENVEHGYSQESAPDGDSGEIFQIQNNISGYPYEIRLYNGKMFLALDKEIKRTLTSEEIKEYEIKKDVNKYNL